MAVACAWQRDRHDLLLKIKTVFTDAWNEFEDEKKRIEDRERQSEICFKLHQKVKLNRKLSF